MGEREGADLVLSGLDRDESGLRQKKKKSIFTSTANSRDNVDFLL